MKIKQEIMWLLLLCACCIASITYASQNTVCHQSYALCTTAPCTPVPGTKNKSICSCVVEDGPSIGRLSCNKRKPTTNKKGQQLLTSNFSFKNVATNKVMVCKDSHPWTDCLDKPCIIDPQNSNNAVCTCDIKYSKNFLTLGGECDTSSCGTTLYSGASTEMMNQGTQELMKALHLSQSPVQYCPT